MILRSLLIVATPFDLIVDGNDCSFFHEHTRRWRRLIGCLELQVIFGKRATKYTALLQKMTYEDKASYDSTPPSMVARHSNMVVRLAVVSVDESHGTICAVD